MREKSRSEDLGVDGRTILKWWDEVMNGIGLSLDKDRQPALVDVVINVRVAQKAGNFFSSLPSRTRIHGVT